MNVQCFSPVASPHYKNGHLESMLAGDSEYSKLACLLRIAYCRFNVWGWTMVVTFVSVQYFLIYRVFMLVCLSRPYPICEKNFLNWFLFFFFFFCPKHQKMGKRNVYSKSEMMIEV